MLCIRLQRDIGDGARFAELISRTRNYLTHFEEEAKGKSLVTLQELCAGTEQMSAMLKMLFAQTLELDETRLLDTAWGNRLLQRLQRARNDLRHRYDEAQ